MAGTHKIELEFIINTSSKILYNCISTPSGLSEWFTDDVNIHGDIYTFFWDEQEEEAKLLANKPQEYVRFRWMYEEDESRFFEFRIRIDPMTKEVALIVTDHCDDDEVDETTALWETQVSKLKLILGGG